MTDFLLEKHNPWWTDPSLLHDDVTLLDFARQKYKYYHPFLEVLPHEDGVIVIRGPRRIGKTTLLKLLIKKLLPSQKSSPRNFFFYPCNRIADYNQLYDLLTSYLGQKISRRRFIFLDEITSVSEWQRTVKDLWDSGDFRDCTVILTGSNALDLQISSERLPGRRGQHIYNINCLPLTFSEFVRMTAGKKDIDLSLRAYLICGGFPQAINEFYRNGFISNVLYETYLNWIEGDIEKLGKSERFLYATVSEIFKHLGSTVSWYKIAQNTGIGSHSTVENYIDNLGKLFVSFSLNFHSVEEKKTYLNKNKKIYFSDPVIFHSLRGKTDNFTDQFFQYAQIEENHSLLPSLVENIVALHLKRLPGVLTYGHYGGKEVDFVVNHQNRCRFFEVKFQNNIRISDFAFWQKKEPLTVITKNFSFRKNNLRFIPLAEFLLNI